VLAYLVKRIFQHFHKYNFEDFCFKTIVQLFLYHFPNLKHERWSKSGINKRLGFKNALNHNHRDAMSHDETNR
jgi:hypothetical protein